jgi:hypothetical protein
MNKKASYSTRKQCEVSAEQVAQYSGSEVGKIQHKCWKQPHTVSVTPMEILNY